MEDGPYDNEHDAASLWIKDTPRGSGLPGVSWLKGVSCPPGVPCLPDISRFRRWLFPAVTAVVILVVIIVLGVSNTKMSNRVLSAEQSVSKLSTSLQHSQEQSVSKLSNAIQSLNTSLKRAQETVKVVPLLLAAVNYNKEQLASVSEALKQLSVVDSLSRSIAALRCSLDRIMHNSSAVGDCCPLDWDLFGSSCYFFSSLSLSWNDSRDWCSKYDSDLVILNTDEEWDFITHRTIPNFYWVGLSDERTGKWEWVNHTPYTIERRRWVPGQPDSWAGHGLGHGDEDCAHLHTAGNLNDLHCSTKMQFICQKRSMHS